MFISTTSFQEIFAEFSKNVTLGASIVRKYDGIVGSVSVGKDVGTVDGLGVGTSDTIGVGDGEIACGVGLGVGFPVGRDVALGVGSYTSISCSTGDAVGGFVGN
eukprot:TRINITY_DN6846_c0_g1_i1.p1 TRINITY_DN6846_c0_g1~~TRINITY_DN6846_c0_g1_i1.p1  ORF type:complete len:104 (-),score=17.37 TRINITY_DN6846_c0_g1_i1:117-428(-)